MKTEKNSYSVMADLEYDYRAFVWQRARKKCSFGILQELFLEQNTTSVEGKASREERTG